MLAYTPASVIEFWGTIFFFAGMGALSLYFLMESTAMYPDADSYMAVADRAFGQRGCTLVQLFFALLCFGTIMTYFIIIGTLLPLSTPLFLLHLHLYTSLYLSVCPETNSLSLFIIIVGQLACQVVVQVGNYTDPSFQCVDPSSVPWFASRNLLAGKNHTYLSL